MILSKRRTKIIATIGHALLKKGVLEKAIKKVDALRFNFSHFTPTTANPVLRRIESATSSTHNVALIADLKGPEIRSDQHSHVLKKNTVIKLACQTPPAHNNTRSNKTAPKNHHPSQKDTPTTVVVGISHPKLYALVAPNQVITADDGKIAFKVIQPHPRTKTIDVKVTIGGTLAPNKTLNVPKVDLKLNILDERDKATLTYVCKKRFNWIAASFINCAQDIITIKKFIADKNPNLKIIAKIETRTGVKNIDEIIAISDGVMIARGDLGENFPYEQIPSLQNLILQKTQRQGKLIIVATQMLETLMTHVTPKRPEVTDVAIAVRSRVDAVMLSGETAVGHYPLKAIDVMHKIISETEKNLQSEHLYPYSGKELIFPIIKQGLELARMTTAKYLIAITTRGKSPRIIAALRPPTPCIVACYYKPTFEHSHLYYAVSPIMIKRHLNKEQDLKYILKNFNLVKKNENIIFVFGFPFKINPTNTIRWIKMR
ncbi:pyruvate kinase [Spirochaetota bacterium]|nr:pyruvate kinase [Spirochaetota bacterium]